MPSFEMTGLLIFTLLSVLPAAVCLHLGIRYLRFKDPVIKSRNLKTLGIASAASIVLYTSVAIDAFWLEPNWPVLKTIELTGNLSEPLSVLHISDLHIEEDLQPREKWLLDTLTALSPDIIFITGDSHQLGNNNIDSLRRILGQLHAPLGVFACIGYDNVSMLTQAADQIDFIVNESRTIEHGMDTIGIVGLIPVGQRNQVYAAIADADYRIAINHTPDLADEAADSGMDLYLCGHTHGGQVRIPFWGAIITNANSGKKYESGLYRKGQTFIHTSRGLGLEPRPAPQVRFFCRPEITLITIRPAPITR